jgi:polyisoprenoid-binding protein YceI
LTRWRRRDETVARSIIDSPPPLLTGHSTLGKPRIKIQMHVVCYSSMNKTLSIVIALIVIALVAFFVMKGGSGPKEPITMDSLREVVVAPAGAAPITDGSYNVTPGSNINWVSQKVVKSDWIDRGTLSISNGTLLVAAGVPVAGTFQFDMNSIVSNFTGGKENTDGGTKLSEHLKSADWFNVAQFPNATFVLTRIVPAADAATSFKYTVTGRLTMKDVTQEVTADALVYNEGGQIKMVGSAMVDRTLWDIRFGSSKFFQDLGDQVISDSFVVNFNVSAAQTEAAPVPTQPEASATDAVVDTAAPEATSQKTE